MHVIVTGGAGFIGSNVAAECLRDRHRVTILDNLARPGVEKNVRWLEAQAAPGLLRFVRGDVRDAELVNSIVGANDVHEVFHFAAQTAVTTSLVEPRHDLEVNVLGTHNVLEAVRQSRAAVPPVLFYTSTNKVYGALSTRHCAEAKSRFRFVDANLNRHGVAESEPLDFYSPYGCSKGAADQFVHDYARIYGLRTVVFRMSCIYGARQFGTEDQGWVAHFMLAAATKRPLTIYGNGKQVRDLLYVDDLVRAFKLASRNITTTAGNVYNIGGGPANSVSVWYDLRARLERFAGGALDVQSCDWRPGDQPVYVTDTRKALRDFGWSPQISVDQGLARLWDWVLELSDNSVRFAPKPKRPALRLPVPVPGAALASPSA